MKLQPPTPELIAQQVATALSEDIGAGDATAALIPADTHAQAGILCREPAVLCGQPWLDEVFRQLSPDIQIRWLAEDGDRLNVDQPVCVLDGPARALLTGERTALNFLQTLSGTATIARRYVLAVSGTRAKIMDTRKTLPGLRIAQKYAVRCGGAYNQRTGLYDGILIKENHITAAGSIRAAVDSARTTAPDLPLQVEVENLGELEQALAVGVRLILLDNFTPAMMREAVALNAAKAQPAELEASGNMTLESIRPVAETGVDRISIGGLTKHVQAIDFSLRFR